MTFAVGGASARRRAARSASAPARASGTRSWRTTSGGAAAIAAAISRSRPGPRRSRPPRARASGARAAAGTRRPASRPPGPPGPDRRHHEALGLVPLREGRALHRARVDDRRGEGPPAQVAPQDLVPVHVAAEHDGHVVRQVARPHDVVAVPEREPGRRPAGGALDALVEAQDARVRLRLAVARSRRAAPGTPPHAARVGEPGERHAQPVPLDHDRGRPAEDVQVRVRRQERVGDRGALVVAGDEEDGHPRVGDPQEGLRARGGRATRARGCGRAGRRRGRRRRPRRAARARGRARSTRRSRGRGGDGRPAAARAGRSRGGCRRRTARASSRRASPASHPPQHRPQPLPGQPRVGPQPHLDGRGLRRRARAAPW